MTRFCFRVALLAMMMGSGSAVAQPATPPNAAPAQTPAEWKRGRELAQKYCSTCHLFPEPDQLTKTAWIHHIQPGMAKWLGLEQADYEGMPDGKLLLQAGLYPPSPIISEEDWFVIWDYYRAAAPSRPLPQAAKPPIQAGLKQFRVHKLNPSQGAPMISVVRIDATNQRLYVGDGMTGALFALNPAGEVIGRTRLESGPVGMVWRDPGTYLTLIGRLFPSDAREGAVFWVPKDPSTPGTTTLLEHLRRPVDTVVADLNNDGRDDLVVCQFGNHLGQFSWFENRGAGRYDEHVLLDRPGAVQAAVRDFDGDGRLDILVMMAQAREGVYLFLNQGHGKFAMQTVMEKPPTWGFAGFTLADFNRDGRLDLITANGDNGDISLPLKSHHGIRVYLNEGTNQFREAFFHPMHGAYKAVARDFDGDGDLDIAAIAFYPDFSSPAPESFVFLENQGGWGFVPFTCSESNSGRWLVMDVGDLDGDGDDDIVLGSFVRGPTTVPVPQKLRDAWRTTGAAVLLLENVRKH